MILAGDVGGTNARLALFDAELRPLARQTYPSRSHASLEAIVASFVSSHPAELTGACFGVAGPVKNGRSETTNLPWVVEAKSLSRQLGLPGVGLINDLEANAWGIGALGPSDCESLQPGAPNSTGNAALISAGTGLGEAGLLWTGEGHIPVASEGGHADFAPRNDTEVDLLKYLRVRYGHVSCERVLSGPGLRNVYEFLRDSGRAAEPSSLADELAHSDPAAAIARHALAGDSSLCEHALELFVSIYGAEAGNHALRFSASGGVFLGGGIAPKILPVLKRPTFLAAYGAKGRLAPFLEATPVRVILNDQAALMGAGRWVLLRAAAIGLGCKRNRAPDAGCRPVGGNLRRPRIPVRR